MRVIAMATLAVVMTMGLVYGNREVQQLSEGEKTALRPPAPSF